MEALKPRGSYESGATAVEYGLLISLIALAILIGVAAFSQSVSGLFETANTCIPLNN